jgi:hypothetical protein
MIFRSNRTSTTLRTHRSLRNAANRLPHNRERRLLDDASDMLKLPPGLAEVAAQKEGGKAAQVMKAKEIQRDQKWRKMAKLVQSGTDKGGGMLFEFDTKDSRLVNRTWKGIPDRWRAAAWWSFLSTSAKRAEDSPTDKELIESFYELQTESSAEDMQIDVDVPRTINSHIMFRRRYRGGQRLLFRVLHAMSLYLPDTGYVQGMAPLAATLLCYYEEDKAFVMLVRLWMLRGLEKLYESGFAGLMEALDDFERNWLREGDIKKKLVSRIVVDSRPGPVLTCECRTSWAFRRLRGERGGTSLCSTTRFHFRRSCACGMSSCCWGMRRTRTQRLDLGETWTCCMRHLLH